MRSPRRAGPACAGANSTCAIESDPVVPRVRTIAAIRATLEGEGVRVVGGEREGDGVLLRPRPEAPRPDGGSRVG